MKIIIIMNLQENISRFKETMGVINDGLHDTSWQNDEGDKITFVDQFTTKKY